MPLLRWMPFFCQTYGQLKIFLNFDTYSLMLSLQLQQQILLEVPPPPSPPKYRTPLCLMRAAADAFCCANLQPRLQRGQCFLRMRQVFQAQQS